MVRLRKLRNTFGFSAILFIFLQAFERNSCLILWGGVFFSFAAFTFLIVIEELVLRQAYVNSAICIDRYKRPLWYWIVVMIHMASVGVFVCVALGVGVMGYEESSSIFVCNLNQSTNVAP